MNRTFSRREAAKKIGTTAAVLKQFEADGAVVPLRDEKKRPRYAAEMVEALRPLVPSTGPVVSDPLPVVASAPPVVPLPSAEPYMLPPQSTVPSVPPLTPEEQSWFEQELRQHLAAEAARFGATTAELVGAWQRANTPIEIPASFYPFIDSWAQRLGMSIDEMWQTLMSFLPAVQIPTQQQAYAQQPTYYNPAPQYPPFAPRYVAPPTPARPRYMQPQRPAGFYPTPSPWSGYMPPLYQPSQPAPDPVREARNLFEVQRIELERRRLERVADDEDEARRRTEEAEIARAAELERARALAVAQAVAEQQYREKQSVQQREEAQRYAAAQAEEQRRLQAEQEQIERGVMTALSEIPAFVPAEVVEDIRQQVWNAVQGRSATVAPSIARDLVSRAVAPYQEEARRMEARRKVAEIAGGTELLLFFRDGPEAQAVAAQAVHGYLDSGAADHLDFITALYEARRIRDAAVEEHRRRSVAETATEVSA